MPAADRRRSLDRLVPLLAAATVFAFACGSSSVPDVTRVGHGLRWAALGVLLAAAALWALPRPRPSWPPTLAAGSLFGLAVLSTAWSVEPRLSFERGVSLGVLFATCLALAGAAAGRPDRVAAILAGLLGGAVAVGLAGLVLLAVAHGDAVQAATYDTPARLRGFGQDPNTVALLFAVAMPLGVAGLLVARTTARRLVAAVAVALLAATTVATGSRGGLVAAALGSLVVVTIAGGSRRRALLGAVAVAALFVAGVGVQSLPKAAAVSTSAAPAQAGSTPRPGYVDAEAAYPLDADVGRPLPGGGEPPRRRRLFAASGRLDAWGGALHEAARRPVAGHGFGTEREVFVDRYYRFVGGLPENSYLGLALQLGVAGLLVLALLVGTLVRPALRALRGPRRDLVAACLGVLVAGLAMGVAQSYLYSVGNIATATFWIGGFLLPAAADG